ncbi:MAG TPA: type VI secretion system-associated FHA domain protein [Ramlibacter sp.]|uniref:type VI secretion system-associated FHA domain protein n=1 Tax=Ramlibacter sp. TaxID=1917967 RepID=UPI002C86F625|nr:type VI secretion system-associated FHA domain protein [Ramlibacter sp.]HVZ46450.1 type VI secretion system-associated FHA domain protein [Ramlibacter sp.]
MALELRIAGPGLDVTRRLEPGQPALILGRDAECTVCLPDTERNVSRRHLSVWNEGDQLHFHVLSVVNGVDMPFGEAPPGARGILPVGQVLKIAAYTLTVESAAGSHRADADPWVTLRHGDPQETQPVPLHGLDSEADPFGDWGFETTFGSDDPQGGGGLHADGLTVAQDIAAFYQGLGIQPQKVGVLSQGELEAIGRTVRIAMIGVVELHKSVVGAKQELRAEDRTMLAPKGEKNPLKEGSMPQDVALHFLFGGRVAAAGYMGPERALREVMADLRVHEEASAAAVRAAIEGVLREFDPEAMKKRLIGDGSHLFESSRAWDAYTKEYDGRREQLTEWAQRLLDKYFAGAYLRESQRLKRETGAKRP